MKVSRPSSRRSSRGSSRPNSRNRYVFLLNFPERALDKDEEELLPVFKQVGERRAQGATIKRDRVQEHGEGQGHASGASRGQGHHVRRDVRIRRQPATRAVDAATQDLRAGIDHAQEHRQRHTGQVPGHPETLSVGEPMRGVVQLTRHPRSGPRLTDRLHLSQRRRGQGLRVEGGEETAKGQVAPPVFEKVLVYWDYYRAGDFDHCGGGYCGDGE